MIINKGIIKIVSIKCLIGGLRGQKKGVFVYSNERVTK